MSLQDPNFSGGDFGFGAGGGGFNGLSGKATNAQSLGFGDTSSQFGMGTDGMGGNIWGKGGMASMALGGLQTLGSIWNSFQQMKLAKKTLKFQKNAFKTNLANSTKVYNTALEDRIRARYATEGRSEEADAKIAANQL